MGTIASRAWRRRSRSSRSACAAAAASRRRRTPTRPTASCARAICGARCATFATTCPASATPSSAGPRELRALARPARRRRAAAHRAGPGGTGKTRLVRRYGRTWLGDWPGGVYFCDLSEARTLDGIHSAVAIALGIPLGRADAGLQLGHAIAGRGRCLVILDNFEQVVEHAPASLGRWLDRAVEASFVVTSRARLHLPGEEVMTLDPLPLEERCASSCSCCAPARSNPNSCSATPTARGRRARAPARRSAARDRAGRSALAGAVACATGRAAERPLQAARRRPRRRPPPGHAARRDRLVVGPAHAVGAGRVRAMLGVRARLHARRGRDACST